MIRSGCIWLHGFCLQEFVYRQVDMHSDTFLIEHFVGTEMVNSN